jgi:hypothetical protein
LPPVYTAQALDLPLLDLLRLAFLPFLGLKILMPEKGGLRWGLRGFGHGAFLPRVGMRPFASCHAGGVIGKGGREGGSRGLEVGRMCVSENTQATIAWVLSSLLS